MNSYQKKQNEKHQTLETIVIPLGFVVYGQCTFKHEATGYVVDLSASSLEPQHIMTNIIRLIEKINYLKGQVDRATAIANLLNVEDEIEKLNGMFY